MIRGALDLGERQAKDRAATLIDRATLTTTRTSTALARRSIGRTSPAGPCNVPCLNEVRATPRVPVDSRPSHRVRADGHLRATGPDQPVSRRARARSLFFFAAAAFIIFQIFCHMSTTARVEGERAAGGRASRQGGPVRPRWSSYVRPTATSLTCAEFSHYLVKLHDTSYDDATPLISIYNASPSEHPTPNVCVGVRHRRILGQVPTGRDSDNFRRIILPN